MHVEFFGLPRERAGISAIEVQADEKLSAQIPPLREFVRAQHLHPVFVANLNGNRFVTDPATPLDENDHLLILSADAGG